MSPWFRAAVVAGEPVDLTPSWSRSRTPAGVRADVAAARGCEPLRLSLPAGVRCDGCGCGGMAVPPPVVPLWLSFPGACGAGGSTCRPQCVRGWRHRRVRGGAGGGPRWAGWIVSADRRWCAAAGVKRLGWSRPRTGGRAREGDAGPSGTGRANLWACASVHERAGGSGHGRADSHRRTVAARPSVRTLGSPRAPGPGHGRPAVLLEADSRRRRHRSVGAERRPAVDGDTGPPSALSQCQRTTEGHVSV